VEGGVDHLVARHTGLHQQAPGVMATARQAGGPGQHGQGGLGGAVAGGEQLLVEVEEGHRAGAGHPVEHGLGPDEDAGAGRRRAGGGVGGHLGHGLVGQQLQLLPGARHPDP
jgi:hypothetical protein